MRIDAFHPRALIGVALASAAVLFAACSGGGDAAVSSRPLPTARIAYLADLSQDGGAATVATGYQGAVLAGDEAMAAGTVGDTTIEVALLDTHGDPADATQLAREVVADPEVVAAIVGPGTLLPDAAVAAIAEGGIPIVSLSTIERRPTDPGPGWYRVVARVETFAGRLARFVGLRARGAGVCLGGDGTPASIALVGALSEDLHRHVVLRFGLHVRGEPSPELVDRVRASGCRLLVWGGSGGDAASILMALSGASVQRVRLVGGDATRTDAYLLEAGSAADGSIAACACADLSTSTDIAAQRFINRFQFAFGVTPGVYAVEGYDVGRLIAVSVGEGRPSRGSLAERLASAHEYVGLGGTYTFRDGGELRPASVRVRYARAEASRWVPIGVQAHGRFLPVHP